VWAVTAGTVVRFDSAQGYGFITPDDGGEDVFLHVSLFDEDMKPLIRSGLRVEFQAVKGDRGLKAVRARTLDGPPADGIRPRDLAFRRDGAPGGGDDDELCDVLSAGEFAQEITDTLIEMVPDMTGAQIMRVRRRLVAFGQAHGWVESD
jgi:CspA family cold shock protein